jgi:hypothetical protein
MFAFVEKPCSLRLLLLILLPLAVALAGCDEAIEQEPRDEISQNNFFQNEDEFLSAAAGVYAQRRSIVPNDIVKHSADGIMVPTRGPDWGDGGVWRELTQHNFNENHSFLQGLWDTNQTGIARANGVLAALEESDFAPDVVNRFTAEMRFMRAYFYYWLMDLFAAAPIVVHEGSEQDFPTQPVDPGDPPPHNSRKEVYDFILQELSGCTSDTFQNDCMSGGNLNLNGGIIPNLGSDAEVPYGRATQEAGTAFLARLLINAPVFAVEVGGQAGGSPQDVGTGPELYEGAAAAADRLINSGTFKLEENYFTNFKADNHQLSDEIIFPAVFAAEDGAGFTSEMSHLHINHGVPATPWNGFTTIAEYYKAFDVEPGEDGEIGTRSDNRNDERAKQFLLGEQYQEPSEGCFGINCFSDPESGRVQVRGGDDASPLILTLEIPSIRLGRAEGEDLPFNDATFVLESTGARPLKFELDPGATDENMGNDWPIFRLAEMYLIKAEAENELSGPNEALPYLNALRERAGAETMSSVSSRMEMHQLIVQEEGFEFLEEGGLRRQYLIRYEFAHGGEPVGYPGSDNPDSRIYAPTFTGPWLFKKDGSKLGQPSEPKRVLFPLPASQLSINPNLSQNPGY